MNKHTPGPWKTKRHRRKRGEILTPTRYIESENPLPGNGETVCNLGAGAIHFANAEANARLIESAPDLLDMVKKLHHSHWADMPCELNAECGRLIARATGGAA